MEGNIQAQKNQEISVPHTYPSPPQLYKISVRKNSSVDKEDDSESDDVDSILGEGDESSQPEPLMFDDARDALATAAANDRSVVAPTTSNNPTESNTQTVNSHLNVPRLPTQTAITGLC